MLYIVTVATHSERYLPVLEKQVLDKGIVLTKLGFGEKYYGHEMKDKELLKFLSQKDDILSDQKTDHLLGNEKKDDYLLQEDSLEEDSLAERPYLLDDEDIVVFLDGFDTLCLAPTDEIIDKFKKMNKKLVVSVENVGILSFIHSAIFNRVRGKFINTGLFIGYAGFMREFLTRMYQYNTHKYSNQKTWSDFIYKNAWKHFDANDIGLDIDGELFLNYSFTVNDTYEINNGRVLCKEKKPCFIQGNGCADLNNIINKNGYRNQNTNVGKMWKDQLQYNYKALFVLYAPILNLYIYLAILLVVILLFILYKMYKKYKLSKMVKSYHSEKIKNIKMNMKN